MARRVRVQAIIAIDAAEGKISACHNRTWFIPASDDARPTTEAIMAKTTKNPVAALPLESIWEKSKLEVQDLDLQHSKN
ncbi:hypothetical protein FRX31_025490 [Thalictrum thalictroides]|uniref:Uncharacterized protein n=1 Tax=Thalictrum thalictroides TaxID=46969 RepID=A0A7J6VJ38_THATH|nr:hypothetical protein FRX31_025490 [Thalictrum thalictroides]